MNDDYTKLWCVAHERGRERGSKAERLAPVRKGIWDAFLALDGALRYALPTSRSELVRICET